LLSSARSQLLTPLHYLLFSFSSPLLSKDSTFDDPTRVPSTKHWVSDALKQGLGPEKYEKLRDVFLWKKDELNNMEGISTSARTEMPGVPNYHGYRYPAPGSQRVANVPTEELGSDPYDINYYGKDRTRMKRTDISIMSKGNADALGLEIIGTNDDEESMDKALAPPETMGSPGNKGRFATGVSTFDPSELRTAMQTNHAAMNASLAKHAPTQLPNPEWYSYQDEIVAMWDRTGQTPKPGYKARSTSPASARQASW
jgi:hypothetical protein